MQRPLIFFTIFLCLISTLCRSQHSISQSKSFELPSWVAMIDNPQANYYEAIKSFDSFWKNKERPEEEVEFRGKSSHRKKRKHSKEDSNQLISVSEREYLNLLKYHYKRFENWEKEVAPFVQEDGSILTQQQRLDIWYRQQDEIQKQNK